MRVSSYGIKASESETSNRSERRIVQIHSIASAITNFMAIKTRKGKRYMVSLAIAWQMAGHLFEQLSLFDLVSYDVVYRFFVFVQFCLCSPFSHSCSSFHDI